MGLEIYGSGITGQILVEDQRPDGSVILLECFPYGARQQTAPAGVAVPSSPGGSWPMLQEAGLAQTRRGTLHLDTTRLPGGPLRFNVSVLASRAAQALSEGVRLVELRMEDAEEWGYAGEVLPDADFPSPPDASPPPAVRQGRRPAATQNP